MRSLLLSLLLFTMLGTKAQLMDWGNPQKLGSRNYYCKFIGFKNDAYFYLRCKKPDFKNEVTVEKYSRNLTLLWSRTLNTSRLAESLQQVFLLKNSLLIIRSEDNYSNGFTEVNAVQLSFDGELSTNDSHLFQIKTSGLNSNNDDDRFVVRLNNNLSMFVVCCITQTEKRNISLNYNLFNENLDNIGSGGYVYPGKTDQFFINDILLHEYNVYTLISYNDINKKSTDDIFLHDLVIMNGATRAFTKIPILLEGKIQSDLGFYLDTIQNKMQLTGFYSEKKSTSAAGVALYTMPLESPAKYTAAFTPFPKELLSKILGERNSARTKEMEDFMVHKIVPRSDGGIILISECFYIEKQAYNAYTSGIQGVTPQPTIFRNIYNYDEVLIFSLDTNAFIDWWQVITKNQNSINDDGYNLSIATLVKKDMIYIFYNLNYHSSNEILEYSISSSGKMKNKILFKSNSYYIDFTPRQCRQVATGSLLMPLIKDKKFNLLKLTY